MRNKINKNQLVPVKVLGVRKSECLRLTPPFSLEDVHQELGKELRVQGTHLEKRSASQLTIVREPSTFQVSKEETT